MAFYRCLPPSSGGYTQEDIDSFYVECEGVKYFPNYGLFASNNQFNSPINVGANVKYIVALARSSKNFNSPITFGATEGLNIAGMLYSTNFNRPITIPANSYCYQALGYCNEFNSPITFLGNGNYCQLIFSCPNFNSPLNFANCDGADISSLLSDAYAFNQPVTFPTNAKSISGIFRRCYNFNQPVNLPIDDGTGNGCDCSATFNWCNTFNYPIVIKNVTSMFAIFNHCHNFNSPVTFVGTYGPSVSGTDMFNDCPIFNQPLNFSNVNLSTTSNMFCNAKLFNAPITFSPNQTISESAGMFENSAFNQDYYVDKTCTIIQNMFRSTNFAKNLYINGNFLTRNNRGIGTMGAFESCNNSLRKNIYINSNLNQYFNNSTGVTIVGAGRSITWTAMTNGYYNQAYNIYVYTNYAG